MSKWVPSMCLEEESGGGRETQGLESDLAVTWSWEGVEGWAEGASGPP